MNQIYQASVPTDSLHVSNNSDLQLWIIRTGNVESRYQGRNPSSIECWCERMRWKLAMWDSLILRATIY